MEDISYVVVNGVRYPIVDGTTVNIDGVAYTIDELLAIAQQPTNNNTEEPQQEQPSESDNETYPDVSYIVLNGEKYSIDDEQATTDLQKLQESIAHPYNDAITYSIGDYCIYSGYLFRCIFSIDTPEEFNQYHWELSVLTDNDVIESYNDLEDKPFINGVELQGGENTIPIPSKTSDLQNDSGFITHEEIFTDLGVVDAEPYDDDIYAFLNTLTEDGWYKFLWDNGDGYSYFVQVQAIESDGVTYVNQHYWGLEENPITEYIRGLTVEDGEVVEEETASYITFDGASNTFAPKNHTHYRTDYNAVSVWDYCDSSQIRMQNGSPILYTDTLNNRQYVIETWQSIRQPTYNFQKVTDLIDSSVFYQRSGYYQGGVTTWSDWQEFRSGVSKAFTVTLTVGSWSSNAQTVSNNNFIANGYAYIVSPASANYSAYTSAQIYADDVDTDGQMTFHCGTAPTGNITVNIVRTIE